MKKYRLILPIDVQDEIRGMVRYIGRDSPERAAQWKNRLLACIRSLTSLPLEFAVDRPSSDRMGYDVRKVAFERTYLVFYSVDQSTRTVNVLCVRHGARLPREGEP
jgi:plasmid stabilization system protein ParE